MEICRQNQQAVNLSVHFENVGGNIGFDDGIKFDISNDLAMRYAF